MDGLYCGETDHFTSFAILLGGAETKNGGGPCSSSSDEFSIITWLSLSAVLLALLVICFVVFVYESYQRFLWRKRVLEERELSAKLCAAMQAQPQYNC